MGKSFDFNKVPRKTMEVTLKSGQRLLVKMPQKKTFERIMAIEEIEETAKTGGRLDALDSICAEILSNNVGGVEVTKEQMAEELDLEDELAFIEAYVDFANGAKDDPN